MTLPKHRGVSFEYRCAYLFNRLGYGWKRSRGSYGSHDLEILKDGKPRYFISCKKTMRDFIYIEKKEIEKLKEEARGAGVIPLVCFGFSRTPVMVIEPKNIKRRTPEGNYKLVAGDGEDLREWIKRQRF